MDWTRVLSMMASILSGTDYNRCTGKNKNEGRPAEGGPGTK